MNVGHARRVDRVHVSEELDPSELVVRVPLDVIRADHLIVDIGTVPSGRECIDRDVRISIAEQRHDVGRCTRRRRRCRRGRRLRWRDIDPKATARSDTIQVARDGRRSDSNRHTDAVAVDGRDVRVVRRPVEVRRVAHDRLILPVNVEYDRVTDRSERRANLLRDVLCRERGTRVGDHTARQLHVLNLVEPDVVRAMLRPLCEVEQAIFGGQGAGRRNRNRELLPGRCQWDTVELRLVEGIRRVVANSGHVQRIVGIRARPELERVESGQIELGIGLERATRKAIRRRNRDLQRRHAALGVCSVDGYVVH